MLKSKPNGREAIVRAAIRFAGKAHAETLAECAENELDTFSAAKVARDAWVASLPALVSRDEIQAYIACVADGMVRRIITGAEARGMLYAAQLALSTISGAKQL